MPSVTGSGQYPEIAPVEITEALGDGDQPAAQLDRYVEAEVIRHTRQSLVNAAGDTVAPQSTHPLSRRAVRIGGFTMMDSPQSGQTKV